MPINARVLPEVAALLICVQLGEPTDFALGKLRVPDDPQHGEPLLVGGGVVIDPDYRVGGISVLHAAQSSRPPNLAQGSFRNTGPAEGPARLRDLRWAVVLAIMVLMTERVPRLSFALDPLIGEAKQRARRRRQIGLGALLVVLLAAGITLGFRSSGGGSSGGLLTAGATARAGELAVPIPRGFHRYSVRGGFYRTGTRPPVIGATVTNFRVKASAPLRVKGVFPLAAPAKGVAFQVALWVPLSAPGTPPPLHLPLSLNDSAWISRPVPAGDRRYGFFNSHGQTYETFVWIGRAAPSHDRAALIQALASVQPAR
jgi:hypothetical protein